MAKAKGATSSGITKEIKELRKRVTTREELEDYLSRYEGTSIYEPLWERCVEAAKENEKMSDEDKIGTATTIDKNGNVKKVTGSRGNYSTNPCSLYFQRMGLSQNKKHILRQRDEEEYGKFALSQGASEIADTYFYDDKVGESNEVLDWINMFSKPNERVYLKQRYANYYDNYEINDGADRTLLSRILSIEIELYRINCKRALGSKIDINEERKLNDMLRETMESMKWTKKQRSAMDDMAQNKFSIWMDKMVKEGKFVPKEHEIPKDEIDMLIEIIPQAVRKMLD